MLWWEGGEQGLADWEGKIHPSKLAPGLASAGLVPQQVERVRTGRGLDWDWVRGNKDSWEGRA